jgi:predicted nucleotidyltransferase
MSLQIEDSHREILRRCLAPISSDVFVFGSRSKGTAKPLSDLDLVIMGEVDKHLLSQVREGLEESNLPYKVDIVLWSEISASFQNQIQRDLKLFDHT